MFFLKLVDKLILLFIIQLIKQQKRGIKMDIPQDWSKLSTKQVNLLLIKILWNLKKYPIKEEPDSVFTKGKYRINENITIEPEWGEFVTESTIEFDPAEYDGAECTKKTHDIGYTSSSYNINGKSVPCSAILPRMLYERCEKRFR